MRGDRFHVRGSQLKYERYQQDYWPQNPGFRKQKKLSQEALAEKCDLHPTYIGLLERGEKNPTVESVMKIAVGLGIPIEQLFANISCSGQEVENYIPDRISCLLSDLQPQEQQIIYDLILTALKLKD